ncbi:MAG TPA: helix-turn-helix transcriptional regulator [Chitinophagales bacterium]|jgi:transcriptional regulator with XRE-family HTH domain|nr:helix-turn-helix transcriptional regulator [Chitinophagales bacterium]
MTIASRIRKIREVRGWKQTAIAASMNITQQAYSCLEQGASNARLETLKRFCDVMKIELPFLIATDVPITEETIERYGNKSYYEFITTYRKLEQKVEIFEELLTGAEKQLNNNTTNNNMSANIRRA